MREQVAHDRLLELVYYDPYTGVFTNKIKRSNISPIGKILGTKNTAGHLVLMIDKTMYLAHRLAWFYCFEEWPTDILDHIDGNPSNNILDNLREASKTTNSYNTGINTRNTSGFRGVSLDKRRNKWTARIHLDGKYAFLGYFTSAEEASKVYEAKAKELHLEFYRKPL